MMYVMYVLTVYLCISANIVRAQHIDRFVSS
jgi:hypothetical protein